jgi:eukaryotic-like serine/threonine-protein kinase
MGKIYRARELPTGEPVALKVLHDAGSLVDQHRFAREARILAELHHPAIVRYIAHGLTPEGAPYLVMEWLEGENLANRMSHGKLAVDVSVALVRRVAEALGAAHARDVVHRDIKPHNLILPHGDVDGVKLVDFGIARRAVETGRLTRTDMFVGTPSYAAPEQVRGERQIDARVDVFALGCVLFECLVGHPPFSGENVRSVIFQILFEEPPHVTELRSDVPLSLGNLVARMLAKDPAARPADGRCVAAEIASLDVAVAASRASRDAGSTSFTGGEQRLVSVILARPTQETLDDLAPTLTPEEVSAPFERLRAIASPIGARVECLPDGSVIAAITSQGAAPDQAAMAAYCALSLRDALRDLPIVLTTGRSVRSARLLVGEAIERAVALLHSASAQASSARKGGVCPIFLDDVTAGLLEQRFEIGGEPGAHELRRERDAAEGVRTLLGRPTPYLGRERELAALEGLWSECVGDPQSLAVLVKGDAGMGKSRLCYEFLRARRRHAAGALERRGSRAEMRIAHGDPMRAGSPFGIVGQLVRHAAGIFEGEPLEERRQKLRARVASRVAEADAARVSEFLGELVGTPFSDEESVKLKAARSEPMLMSDQMKWAFQDFVAAECKAGPVLLVVEDLHWGDLASLQLIDETLRTLPEAPLMALGMARLEVDEIFPDLWSHSCPHEIKLGKLGRRASEQLVQQILGHRVTEATITRVVDQAAGNALYLEELIRAVAAGAKDSLPGTVMAMVQARLDALDPEARQVIRAGCVFGEVFWGGGVAALLASARAVLDLDIEKRLEELVDQEFLERRRQSRFPGQREYSFRHEIVRTVAYAALTEPDRALGHRMAGEWLEGAGEQDAMALAEHFERGGERTHAAVFYARAAEQALEANDFNAVIARAERAAACGAEGEMLGLMRRFSGEAYFWSSIPKAEECDLSAMELLPKGTPHWYNAVGGSVVAACISGGEDARLGDRVEALFTAPVGPSALGAQITVLAQVVRWLVRSGMIDLAELVFDRLVAASDDVANDPMALGYMQSVFALRSLLVGEPAQAHAWFRSSIVNLERAGHVRFVWARRMSAAAALMELGVHAEAEVELREVLAASERLGLGRLRSVIKYRLGAALAQRGALEDARAMESEAIEVFAAQGDVWYQRAACSLLALILLQIGRLDEAEDKARRAVDLCSHQPPPRALALSVLARIHLHQGRVREACEGAQTAMDLLRRLGGIEAGEALVRLVFAEARFAQGRLREAREAISEAAARLRARSAKIDPPAWRESFLQEVPENARTLQLELQWSAG